MMILTGSDYKHMIDVIAGLLVDNEEWEASLLDDIFSVLNGRVLTTDDQGYARALEHESRVNE